MARQDTTHDRIVNDLEARLRSLDRYHLIQAHQEYRVNGLVGEMDLFTTWNLYAHYYEVKSHDNHKARQRARAQFDRAEQAFPSFHWQFIYVTPEAVCRYRDGHFYKYGLKRAA